MPWYILLIAVGTGLLIVVGLVDLFLRYVAPRLSGLRLPKPQVLKLSLRADPSVPDEFYLQVAKTVIEGGFEGSRFGKKPHVDFFPMKKNCPHCKDRKRNPWDLGKAERLLGDMEGLARAIKKRRFCRSCLSQLSEIAKVRKQFEKLGKEDPRSLSFRPLRWGRTFLRFVGISMIVLVLSSLPSLLPFLLRLMVDLPMIMFRF